MGEAGTVRGRRRGGALTREEIIEAAVEISTAEGPAGVTFRALGSRLGVAATALYRHFRDKDELMLALADQIFVEIAERFTPGDDWAADLRQLAFLGREVGRRHAVTLAWLGYRNTGGPGDQAVALDLLRVLLDAGLTQEQALFHYQLLTDTLMGLLTVDAMRESLDADTRRKDDTALAALYANLAREEPRLSHVPALAITADDDDALFAAQIDLHVHAIRATASGMPILKPPA
ncbi:TetR/AcrR family transcriptional regulator [Streptomyces sp. SID13726]|uniref:TetR/AcrR family transcriptional regulator n=1 Tax=Streptomyces sp. SID13726 TaxID=2706058 RepID=UPI0013B5E5A9|nr:TetR/AcrR family transcriptional regulator [Streptomyces sp. SID13726]NEB01038.1 helix-turn-helix transcriptional regulator [Streptomyces sp. SID13726]